MTLHAEKESVMWLLTQPSTWMEHSITLFKRGRMYRFGDLPPHKYSMTTQQKSEGVPSSTASGFRPVTSSNKISVVRSVV